MSLRKLVRTSTTLTAVAIVVLGYASTAYAADNQDRLLPVMTRNLDAGTDFGFIFAALQSVPPGQDPTPVLIGAISQTFVEVVQSGIEARMHGIAQEIQDTQPYLVGLEEITTLRTGPFPGHATTIVADALPALMKDLNARGLHYDVLKAQTNTDLDFPAFDGTQLFTAGLTDADAVLVRTDLPISQLKIDNVQFAQFNLVAEINVGPVPVRFGRGWIAVDAQLRGKPFRFVTTHLESVNPDLQAEQTLELIGGPVNTTLPVILAADLNSGPSTASPDPAVGPVGPAFFILLGQAGFTDIWSQLNSPDPGFTWPLFLEDPVRPSAPTQRIDNILIRGDGITAASEVRTGTQPFVPGLFGSDHAGVAATLVLLPKQ